MNSLRSVLVALIVVSGLTFVACSGSTGNANTGNANSVPAPANSIANANAPANNLPTARAPYPQEVADEFITSCQGAGSDEKLCKCLFEKIQDKYSFEEFTTMELKLSAGDPPDDFVQFVGGAKAQCTRER